jgi:hypothetical protein
MFYVKSVHLFMRGGLNEHTLSESGLSILFKAITVGNFSSVNALTTLSIVSLDQCSSGSFIASLSRQRATICEFDPYPENWF